MVCTRAIYKGTDTEGAILAVKVALGCIGAPVLEGGVELGIVSLLIRCAVCLPRLEKWCESFATSSCQKTHPVLGTWL